MNLRVIVVSDDALARGGLAALLAGEPGVEVVAQVPPDAVLAEEADVAVWDVPAGSGPDAMAGAWSRGIAVLAVLADSGQSSQAIAAGARGAVSRDVTPVRLAAAVRAVAEGLVVLEDGAADFLRRARAEPDVPVEALTAREQEVLQLVADGLSNKLIAARLGISEHTAKFHVNSILGKLAAQTRAEAVAQAARLGLLLL